MLKPDDLVGTWRLPSSGSTTEPSLPVFFQMTFQGVERTAALVWERVRAG